MSFKEWYNRVILRRRQPEALREKASDLLSEANRRETYGGYRVERPVHPVTQSMANHVAAREAAARREERIRRQREREEREEQDRRRTYAEDYTTNDSYTDGFVAGSAAIVAAPIFTNDDSSQRSTFSSEPEISRSEPQQTPDSWGSSPTSYEPPTSYEAPSHSSSTSDWGSSSTSSSDSGGWSSSSDGGSYSSGSDSGGW